MRFLLVDRILRLEEGREAVVRKNVSSSEDYFTDHFEGRPIMPGCLILEACDQAARLLLARSAGFRCLPGLVQVVSDGHRPVPADRDQRVDVVLREAAANIREGTDEERALNKARAELLAHGFHKVDYMDIRWDRILAAAWIGKTRLLDNRAIFL